MRTPSDEPRADGGEVERSTDDTDRFLWRVRGPWTTDDWLVASETPAAEMESREKCDVSIVSWITEVDR